MDTFFACSLMVVLIVSAMVSTAKLVQPYLNELAGASSVERSRSLSEYILMNKGTPSNWGKIEGQGPSAFGLASESQQPYALDLDKVTRLNGQNIHAISYRDVLAALATSDLSFSIRIQTLFQVSVTLASSRNAGNETTYSLQVSTTKSGFPISSRLSCYIIIHDYVEGISSLTDSEGIGMVNVTLPNAVSGVASLVVLAKIPIFPQVTSFGVYSFRHNSEDPERNLTYVRLSPLNYTLTVSLRYSTVEIFEAHMFSYSHQYRLTQTAQSNQSVKYVVPRLSEASPLIFVVRGSNGSTSFAEWTAYPQLPLELGADFSGFSVESNAAALTYVVSIESVLYELVITCRSVPFADA